MWLKRDDMNAHLLAGMEFAGGNKLRALEFLLAPVHDGDTVIAVGGEGSTHVLATVALARGCGARTLAIRWPHHMNPVARLVAARVASMADEVRAVRTAPGALVSAWVAGRAPHVHVIPPGGTCPLGMLGAVNAGLELAAQIASGEMPMPSRVILPLGTGGTAAGLSLGLTIAGLDVRVVAVRVTPRIVANRWRLARLSRGCARLIEQLAGERPPVVPRERVEVVHAWYGGAYGRPLPAARAAQDALEDATGLVVDDTYGAKAFAAALAIAGTPPPRGDGPTLFWKTFDPRWLGRDVDAGVAERAQ